MFALWLGYEIGLLKNKKISASQLWSGHDNTMNKRGGNPMADSNYFYTKKSIHCTNILARLTPFTCTLRARS